MSDILVHRERSVLTLTFNRLDKKNAITAAMYASLAIALSEAVDDDGVRAVVIQGHEQVFTAGNDLQDFLMHPPKPDEDGNPPPVFRFLHTLQAFPKPIVAAVCGPAVGIGTTMLMHCDLVYAGDNAAFSLPFVNLGLCPEAGSSYLLQAMVGYPRAAEKLMLGEAFYAEEAAEMGLVNKVLPPHEANAHAQAVAARLAAKPAESLRTTKALMKKSQSHVASLMDEEGLHFGRLLLQPAAREAFTAFMQKRRPDFTNL